MTTSADPTTPVRDARPWLVLIGFLAATAAVAAIGGLATAPGVDGWYAEAERPAYSPPNAVFGPVWTLLYAAMAVAAWLVWRADHTPARRRALGLWWAQLAVNLAWTPVFFAAEWLWAGLAVIVTLDVLVALTVVTAWRVSRPAALLLAPYLAWVLYATALNAGVAYLN